MEGCTEDWVVRMSERATPEKKELSLLEVDGEYNMCVCYWSCCVFVVVFACKVQLYARVCTERRGRMVWRRGVKRRRGIRW